MDVLPPLFVAKRMLNDIIPLHVTLVRGAHYAVWIDSGVRAMFPLLMDTMRAAGVGDGQIPLRFVLHTHSHHDHIGCNAQLRAATGCLIAAPARCAHWHRDFEAHYREFARPFPDLFPDTPELRDEVFGPLDGEHPVDLYTDEGATFDLGGGVLLTGYSLPGHMLAEMGWFEHSTRTLILGDAITGIDWPFIHGHLTVSGYRATLARLARLLADLSVARVVMAHYPPATPDEARALIARAGDYLDGIETTLIEIIAARRALALRDLWTAFVERHQKAPEFRSLSTVAAHVDDLMARRVLREVAPGQYTLI